MWLLININKTEDVGKNERTRILIGDAQMNIIEGEYLTKFNGKGINVHPAMLENRGNMSEKNEVVL